MTPVPSTLRWANAAPFNGWWPKLSPTGRYLAYGNANVWVVDLDHVAAGAQPSNLGPGWPGSGRTPETPAGAWLNDRELAIITEAGLDRSIRIVDVVTGAVRTPDIPTSSWPARVSTTHIWGRQVAATWTYFRDGARFTFDPTAGRLEGDPIPTPANVLMLAQPDRHGFGVLLDGDTGRIIRELPAVTAYGRHFDGPDGCYVAYPVSLGIAAKVVHIDGPTGVQAVEMPVDQAAPALVWVKGVLWVWSVVWAGHNEQNFAFGRPVGETLGICVEMPNLDFNVRYDEARDVFVLAGYAFGAPQYPASYLEAHEVPADTARTTLQDHLTPFDWPIVTPPADRSLGVWDFTGHANIADGADQSGTKWILEGIGLNADGTPWLRPENWDRLLALWTSRWDSEHAIRFYTIDKIRQLARGYLCADIEEELVGLFSAQIGAGSQDFWPIEKRLAEHVAETQGKPLVCYSDHGFIKNADGDAVGAFDLLPVAQDWQQRGFQVICQMAVPPTEHNSTWEMEFVVRPMLKQLTDAGFQVMLCLALYDQNRQWLPLREIARKLNLCITLPVLGVELFGWHARASDPELDAWLDRWVSALVSSLPAFDRKTWPADRVPVVTPPIVTPPVVIPPVVTPAPTTPPAGHKVPAPVVAGIGAAAGVATIAALLVAQHRHEVAQLAAAEEVLDEETRRLRAERVSMAQPDPPGEQ